MKILPYAGNYEALQVGFLLLSDKMDYFLETWTLPNLTEEDKDSLNGLMAIKSQKNNKNIHPSKGNKTILVPRVSSINLVKNRNTFSTSTLLENKIDGNVANIFYQVSITLISNS